MTTTQHIHPAAAAELPAVPLTTEGYSVLHQMMRIRWGAWLALTHAERDTILNEARITWSGIEEYRDGRQSAQQLADNVGLSATPVWRRVKELEASGVIRGYVALLDREAEKAREQGVTAVETFARQGDGADAIIDVVVVLPCMPATAMPYFRRISSASISAR